LSPWPVATARGSDFVSNRLEFLKLHQYTRGHRYLKLPSRHDKAGM